MEIVIGVEPCHNRISVGISVLYGRDTPCTDTNSDRKRVSIWLKPDSSDVKNLCVSNSFSDMSFHYKK